MKAPACETGGGRPAGRRFDWPAALLLLALVITGWFCLAGLGLQRTVLETRFYQDLTARLELAGYLRGRLLGALEKQAETEPLLNTDLSVVRQALEAALREAWLEEQLSGAAGAIAAFIGGESTGLAYSLKGISEANMTTAIVPGWFYNRDGISYWRPDLVETAQLIENLFNEAEVTP